MQIPVASPRVTALVAAMLFVFAVAVFGAFTPGYSQALHPVAVLGARGMPRAMPFDVLAYVLPGMLAAWVMAGLHALATRMPLSARLGAAMLVLAALAFAMQGVLRLQMGALDSASSAPHAAAWTFWWVAYGAGAVAFSIGARSGSCARRASALLACAAVSILFAIVLPGVVGVGVSQRVAFAGWFAGVYVVASTVAQLHGEDHQRQPERDQVRDDHRP